MTIKKVYKSKNDIEKIITFSIWDDILFNAYSKVDLDNIDFEFNVEDPLYLCLKLMVSLSK